MKFCNGNKIHDLDYYVIRHWIHLKKSAYIFYAIQMQKINCMHTTFLTNCAYSCNFRNLHTDFICWRGLLTKLLCTPYESRDGWILAVTLYNGSYYICDIETEKRRQQKETMTDKGRQMTYWGWKFEQYVTRCKFMDYYQNDVRTNSSYFATCY